MAQVSVVLGLGFATYGLGIGLGLSSGLELGCF